MILNRFLKPKWENADPQARQEMVQALELSDPLLTEAARTDDDPMVRRTALQRISELTVLREAFAQEPDPEVRAAATTRLQELLAGVAADSPPLAERLNLLAAGTAAEFVDYLARHGAEPELRLAALAGITAESALEDIVHKDPSVEVRLAALERVQDSAALERIANEARKRDKRVYRSARERLDAEEATQHRAARAEEACAALEALTWDSETGPNAARFTKLELEWRELEATADEALQQRYSQARDRFLAERQQSSAKRAARQAVCTTLEDLLERLQQTETVGAELDAEIQAALQQAQSDWAAAGELDDLEGRRLERRYAELSEALQTREQPLRRNQQRADRLQAVLKQADKLLNQSSEVAESELTALRQRWNSLEKPEAEALAKSLQAEFDAVLEKLRVRLQKQTEQRDKELKEIQELIDALEQSLEEGRLQQAISFQDRARKQIKQNIGLSRKQMAALEERLQSCAPRLAELRGWRRWGTNQAREHLCEEAEGLIGSAEDPAVIARRVQEARAAWKALDHTEGAATKALWKRFDQACEQAYAPCQAYFEQQAQERQANLEKKEALCERVETFEAETDWDNVDWREADRFRHKAIEQWRRLGPVSRSDRKKLDRRYQAALKRLDTHLEQERERDRRRREALIQSVEALAGDPDLNAAIEAAKKAQAEWQPTVQSARRDEQALWKRFRAACDAVFERRQAERKAADDERQANLDRRTALCEELEGLATTGEDTLRQSRARLAQIKDEWRTTGPVPRAAQKKIEQRFEAALKQVERHEKTLQRAKQQQTMTALRDRSQLCADLEKALEDGLEEATEQIEQARQAWEVLPEVPAAAAESIQQRFERVCQALSEDTAARQALIQELTDNLEQKQMLCIRMEVVASVESPPEFAKARMEYQVQRLSRSFTQRDVADLATAKRQEALEIEQQWYSTGLLPAAQNAALEQRFLRALEAFTGSPKTSSD